MSSQHTKESCTYGRAREVRAQGACGGYGPERAICPPHVMVQYQVHWTGDGEV